MTAITVGQMQGAIETFWGAIYRKDINAISAMMNSDLKATYQVTINGTKQAPQNLDFNAYIAAVQKMFQEFDLALSTQRTYDPGTFNFANGQATWSINYLQNLQTQAGVMASTGQQTWTYNGVQFIALNVIEYDTMNNRDNSKCALV